MLGLEGYSPRLRTPAILFVSDSESRVLIDADNEDADWQQTAGAGCADRNQ